MRRVVFVALIGVVVAACSVSGNDGSGPSLFGSDIYGSWELTSGTVDSQPIPIVDSHPITLIIGDDAVGGTAGCNHYFLAGSLPVADAFSFGVTEMACSPAEVMESEAAYLAALARVEMSAVDDDLTLMGHRDGEVELHFRPLEPVPTADLLETVWVLDGLVHGDTISSVSGERATLEFFTDGSFIGSTGCRTIVGGYQTSGDEVVFTNWSANGDCPVELATQDSRVISALEGGFRVEIEDARMTTSDAADDGVVGDEGLIYHADS